MNGAWCLNKSATARACWSHDGWSSPPLPTRDTQVDSEKMIYFYVDLNISRQFPSQMTGRIPPPLEVPKQLWQQTNNNSTSPSMIWCQSGANELLAYLCELEVLPVLALNAFCWPKDTNPNASLRRGSEPLGPFQGHIFTKISRQMYRWKMHIHQHDLHAHLQVFEKKVCFPVENSAPSILTKPHFTNACCPNLSKTNQGTKEILCGPLCHNIMQKLMSGTCCSIHFHTFSTVYPIFLSPFVKS